MSISFECGAGTLIAAAQGTKHDLGSATTPSSSYLERRLWQVMETCVSGYHGVESARCRECLRPGVPPSGSRAAAPRFVPNRGHPALIPDACGPAR
jgi:hypothetical protein